MQAEIVIAANPTVIVTVTVTATATATVPFVRRLAHSQQARWMMTR